MRTKDLIALLQQCDPDGIVTVWDAYYDSEDFNVHVSVGRHDKHVHIGCNVFGDEVKVPPPASDQLGFSFAAHYRRSSMATMKAMEEALAAKQDDTNPFVREGETTFMRHDEVRVIQQRPGLVAVEFRWHGALTYTMHAYCDFAAGQTLTLAGLDGRMAVRVF